MVNDLALISDARNALERARTLDDVKMIMDLALAAKKYAEARKLGEDSIRYAQEIVNRAVRRMGEMLQDQVQHQGGRPGPITTVPGDDRSSVGSPRVRLEDLGISKSTSSRAQQIARIPEADFEQFLNQSRDLSMRGLVRHGRESAATRRRANYVDPRYVVGDYDIRHGDLRECLPDLDGTVDAIITDPPYPREYIPLYEDLSLLANRVLKPKTGVLAIMVGHIWLPEIMALLGKHMRYRWICAYMALGKHSRVWGAHVNQGWKPILLYRHPDSVITEMPMILLDVFKSGHFEKEHHEWQQSEGGMNDIVERLSPPGGLVLDPFLGAGTTGVACVDLKRRFIGCDVDASCVEVSRERISSRLEGLDGPEHDDQAEVA